MAKQNLKNLSIEQLEALKAGLQQKAAQSKLKNLGDLSVEELEDLQSSLKKKQESEVGAFEAIAKLGAKGVTFGTTPFAAGVGGAAGAFAGTLEEGRGLEAALGAGKEAFIEARKERREEEEVATRAFPKLGTAAEIGGGLVSGGAALKGLGAIRGGLTAGTAGGLGAGLSVAESPEEALEEAALGGAVGAGFGAVSAAPGALAKTAIGRELGAAAKKAMAAGLNATRKAFVRTASSLTGVAKKDIDTFIDKYGRVSSLIDDLKSADDAGAQFVEEKKNIIYQQVKNQKNSLNRQLSKAIETAEDAGPGLVSPGVRAQAKRDVDIRPILKDLMEDTSKLDPDFDAQTIKQVTEKIIDPLMSAGGQDLRISLGQLQRFKMAMQDLSEDVFRQAQQGKIFSDKSVATKLTTRIANKMRVSSKNLMNEKLPAVKDINEQLSKLHDLGDELKPLLRETTPVSKFTALARQQGKNRKVIEKVDELIGSDFLSEFEDLASAQRFGDAPFLPIDPTGKSFTRLALGVGLGGLTGEVTGLDFQTAAAIGAIATSPAALKQLIKSKALTSKAMQSLSKITGLQKITVDNADQAFKALGRALASKGAQSAVENNAIQRRIQLEGR